VAQENTHGLDWPNRKIAPVRLTIWDGLILLWAIIAFFLSRGLGQRILRLRFRKARRTQALASLLFIWSLPFLAGCEGTSGSRSPQTSQESLEQERLQAKSEADLAESVANKKLEETVAMWAAFLAPQNPDATGSTLLQTNEISLAKRIREAAIVAELTQRLATESSLERDQLEADSQALSALISTSRWRAIGYASARVLAAALLIWLAITPIRLARKAIARDRKQDNNTCPCCAQVGKLSARKSSGDERSTLKQPRIVECRVCGNQFPEQFRDEPRLCFPTIGIRASGKTHMLATAYHLVKTGRTQTNASLLPMPSLADAQFDVYINLILRARATAGETIYGTGDDLQSLPRPIVLHLNDIDPNGRNGVMVNLFDYAGELMEKQVDTDLLRRRACLTDGFLLVLDPTQLYGENGGVYLEDQINEFTRFYQDSAQARKLKPGVPVPIPVAVCITKFDLLPTENPIGGPAVAYIRHLVNELNPNRPMTLELLKQRSQLIEELMPAMLPGTGESLPARLREQFGERVLYFPVSSVNLNPAELHNPERKDRTPAPFGVLEPILWLLHMHGYCVFDDAKHD